MSSSFRSGSQPIRVLFFAHALQGRGTERAVVRLLKEFNTDVIDPQVALVSARGEFLEQVPSWIRLHDLDLRESRTSAAIPRLERVIRSSKPDCAVGVHTSAARALSLLKIVHPRLPVICMEADPFTRIEGDKGHLAIRLWASRITYRLASHIVAASHVVSSDLEIHLGINPQKISLIPLPSLDDDLERLTGEDVDHPAFGSGEPIIVTIGNMYPHKDQATLVRAFHLVNEEVPSHLVIIGEGEMRSALESLATDLGIAERVWFTGFEKNPFKYLARSRAYASSSIAEGFDISQIEAMACGLPVIVTDAPRFKAVTHGITGLVVPPAEPDKLADAVLSVLKDPRLGSTLGRAAQMAAEEFRASSIARCWESVISKLVRTNPGRSDRG